MPVDLKKQNKNKIQLETKNTTNPATNIQLQQCDDEDSNLSDTFTW